MAINMETAINNMYALKNRGIKYSMNGSRTGADGTGDCSGTVYDSLRKAGASNAGWVLNTDSMHNWLLQNSFDCIATNKEWTAKRGDVVIFGPKGASGGAAGHVVIFISNTQVIHCTYKSASANGVFVDNEAAGCPYSMGWYTYRLKDTRQRIVQGSSKPSTGNILSYRVHVQSNDKYFGGTLGYVTSGQTAGTDHKSLRMEWIEVLHDAQGNRVEIDAHVQGKGWLGWKKGSNGTQGQALRMEAIKLRLVADDNLKNNYNILYRTHIQDKGWGAWVKNGAVSGTTGQKLRMEAIQIKTERK